MCSLITKELSIFSFDDDANSLLGFTDSSASKSLAANIAEVESYAKSESIECRAQLVLAGINETDDVDSVLKLRRPKEPLIERLNEFVLDESLVSGEPNVAVFPPEFQYVSIVTVITPDFIKLYLNINLSFQTRSMQAALL